MWLFADIIQIDTGLIMGNILNGMMQTHGSSRFRLIRDMHFMEDMILA